MPTFDRATQVTLAILSGGEARRLGTDKGLYQPLGDEPLVARLIRLTSGTYDSVMVVTRDAEQAELYEQALAQHLTDAERDKTQIVHDQLVPAVAASAALRGIYTALALAKTPRVMTVAVDQLGVRALHLAKLTDAAEAFPERSAAYADDEGELAPLPSLWPRSAVEQVGARIAANSFSIKDALADLGVTSVPVGGYAGELGLNGNTKAALDDYFGAPLFDPNKRRLHYLRFSLTEACNLSCTYCLPDGFPEWYRHKARLGRHEIETLLAGFRKLGFRKVRLTGGEPTVHPDCLWTVDLARRLGFETIAMTTNGIMMPDMARWRDAGLTHLNISLDSLDPDTFRAVTKNGDVHKVIKAVEDGIACGLTVKINTVLMRTINGDHANIEKLIDWAIHRKMTLRFIELMDTSLNRSFAKAERVLGSEIEPLLSARGLSRMAHKGIRLGGPATDYASESLPGRIGLINPLSCNFCSDCNRLRITARGRLKLCLFGDQDLPIDLASADAVALNVRHFIDRKPERHYLEDGNVGNVQTFRTIGG